MADFQLKMSSIEVCQVLVEHVRTKYNLDKKRDIDMLWVGESPIGAVFTLDQDVQLPSPRPFGED